MRKCYIKQSPALTVVMSMMVCLVLMEGCVMNAQLLKAREEYIASHPDRPKEIREAIMEGAIMMGMTREEVILSWGDTLTKNKTVTQYGESEQWVYSKYIREGNTIRNREYLYFENGVLDSWHLDTY